MLGIDKGAKIWMYKSFEFTKQIITFALAKI